MPDQPSSTDPLAAFGPNEWLVDELYQQYLQDKESVDRAWWEFFEDYQPGEGRPNGKATTTGTSGQTHAVRGTDDGNGDDECVLGGLPLLGGLLCDLLGRDK